MSEKRFTLLDETIFDNEKQAEDGGRVTYWVVSYGQRQRLVDLLNEQQATINKLEQENRQLRQFINKGRRLSVKELMANTNENELLKKKIKELEKENKELQKDKAQLKERLRECRIKMDKFNCR